MILVLFGQPNSGKSTIADELKGVFMSIDGDRLRKIFKNSNLSNKASDIATFIDASGLDVVVSLDYADKEARSYLNSLSNDVYWVYLESEAGELEDFDYPGEDEKVLKINTTKTSLSKCLSLIENYISHW